MHINYSGNNFKIEKLKELDPGQCFIVLTSTCFGGKPCVYIATDEREQNDDLTGYQDNPFAMLRSVVDLGTGVVSHLNEDTFVMPIDIRAIVCDQ